MVGPDFHPPRTGAPPSWAGVGKTSAEVTSIPTSQPAETGRWWEQFHDPLLTSLVEEALRENLTVELAIAKLRQARAAEGIAVAGLLPTLNGSGEFQRESSSLEAGRSEKLQNLYEGGLRCRLEAPLLRGAAAKRRSSQSEHGGRL